MLVDVQSFVFYASWDAKSVHFLDAIEENKSAGCCPEIDDQDSEAFSPEKAPAVTVESAVAGREQAREQSAQNAANAMNGTCANRVVDVQAMVDELDGEDQYCSADKTDYDGSQRRDEVTTGCNAYKARQHAVQSQ